MQLHDRVFAFQPLDGAEGVRHLLAHVAAHTVDAARMTVRQQQRTVHWRGG